MATRCRECGTPLADGGACIDQFHTLLIMENEAAPAMAGGGAVAHFYAVSAYILQHPDGMGYTAGALADARRGIADHLAGRVTLDGLRARVRRAADGPARITRRTGDEVARWPVEAWPLTVADVIAGGVEGYADRVAAWAGAVVRTLDEAGVR